jgi:Mlc titration factor MtfA (ptsG expression regulator)
MLLHWLRNRRRQKLLARPFPEAWLGYLEGNVRSYRSLAEAEQARLRDDLRIFIAEKRWEGCRGLEITEEIKVTIAAQACLLILGLGIDSYSRVKTILVYPNVQMTPQQLPGAAGLVTEDLPQIGAAWYRGPVVVSWAHARGQARHPERGRNVVFHEFAHQIDMLDGEIDGTPPLESPAQAKRWKRVMSAEFRRLAAASVRGEATLLDDYGATNPAEFFAVATECFFTRPLDLSHRHPNLYQLLKEAYRQDPAGRPAEPL